MRKLSYFFSIAVLAGMVAISGCKKEGDPEPVADCDNETFPATTGSATIDVLNINNQSGGFFVMNAAAGNVLSLAIEVKKGQQRPQKLRLYQTDCANTLGTIVDLSGQPGAEDGGKRLDLRNTDEQVKQVLYTVPSGYSTLYLNIEIDESGSKLSYERIKLNISNSGIVDHWTSISLGGNSSNTASRLNTATGHPYTACDAAASEMKYIDVTYAVGTGTGNPSFLCSNPARFSTPIGLAASDANCGDDGALSTSGGSATYFKTYAGTDFNTISNTGLAALTVSNTNNQYVEISIGGVYEFLNSSGKKGLIKVVSGTLSNSATDIVVEVKVQR
jgi:hypothetical protein